MATLFSRRGFGGVVFLSLMVGVATQVGAEAVLDLYAGTAQHRPADLFVNQTSPPQNLHLTVDGSASPVLGGRVLCWFERAPWVGLGGDISYYEFDSATLNANVFPASIFGGLRIPLGSTPSHPAGRAQIYGFGGFSVLMADVRASVNGMSGHTFISPWTNTGESSSGLVAPYLSFGVAVQPWKSNGFFLEYRRVAFDVDFLTTNSPLFPTSNTQFKTSFATDQILLGFSFRSP